MINIFADGINTVIITSAGTRIEINSDPHSYGEMYITVHSDETVKQDFHKAELVIDRVTGKIISAKEKP